MTTLTGSARALLTSVAIAWCGAQAQGAEVPAYLKPIVGTQTASPAEVGTKNILQLNASMFELYDASGKIFQRNFLAQHPVILGLFSGAGGRFILYRPGMARSQHTGAGCNRRLTASMRPPCGKTGGQPTAPSCRTILRSWTSVWRR